MNIVIESADIGVGKTTLGKYLHDNIENSIFIEEKIDEKLLKVIYEEVEKTQNKSSRKLLMCEASIFFNRALQQINTDILNTNKICIWDRSLISSLAFSKNMFYSNLLTCEEYYKLEKLYEHLSYFSNFEKNNTYLIHLEASIETLLDRIKNRHRDSEKSLNGEYIIKLRNCYDVVWNFFGSKNINKHYYNWEEFNSEKVLKDIKLWINN